MISSESFGRLSESNDFADLVNKLSSVFCALKTEQEM